MVTRRRGVSPRNLPSKKSLLLISGCKSYSLGVTLFESTSGFMDTVATLLMLRRKQNQKSRIIIVARTVRTGVKNH